MPLNTTDQYEGRRLQSVGGGLAAPLSLEPADKEMNPNLAREPMTSPRIRRRGARGGFTIFEVGIAAAVMAFAIATAITVMQRAFLALDTARSITYASQIMQNELEKMRLLNWTTVGAYSTTATDVPIPTSFTSTSIGARFTGMTRTATVVHSGVNAGMVKIKLTVTWRTMDGRTLSQSYTTYYGQGGLYDYFSS